MKTPTIIAVILSLSWFGIMACSQQKDEALSGAGTLEATDVLLSAKLAGSIVEMAVSEGTPVVVHQFIAQIDTEKIYWQKRQVLALIDELNLNLLNARRGVDLAQNSLENVEKKHQRIKALLADSSATQQQFDDIQTAFDAAVTQHQSAQTSYQALTTRRRQLDAQLQLLNSQSRDARISAPMAGTILEKYQEQGEVARPGMPVAKLADLSRMWVKIYLDEEQLGRVRLGGTARLQVSAYPDKAIPGVITWISPRAEFTPKNVQTKEARADLVYAIKVEADNPDGILKIGMPVDVYFE